MKTRLIIFVLLPCFSFYLGFSQLGPNLAKYEQPYWWVIDDRPVDTIWTSGFFPPPMTAEQFLDRYDFIDYDYGKHGVVLDSVGILCPWQSWRFVIYQSFQVDLILSPQEFDAFEPRLIDEDLMYFAIGGNRDGLNIAERDYFAQLHHPGLSFPIVRNYHYIHPSVAVDWENNNPQWGWHRRILQNGMAMAVKELPGGLFHVSMARFVQHDGY